MNFMLVQYDPFIMESRVFVVKDKHIQQSLVESNISGLAQNLITQAHNYDVYNIKFNAPPSVFENIKDEIATIEAETYGENKIIMEIA